ncbi:MAG: DUF4293 domain-containing protein [Chloroherpetonaceae bacterium]|nr:DUF4293 domain-containing protein [Chloroherpetonaceae bacterium]MCS7210452.1 DUF4293 domain-containing protein [Chloroherpetonaceae bacterium]MDW8018856.1 DUF4293 domain-containing protein [Chloroherpetonaceae bacterium]MDW8466699.1 DUF4293 domain-containing protein [Chloroherpetonaceae bacterium]
MLARIQTLYLLLATLCAVMNFGIVPFWQYSFPDNPAAAQMTLYGFGSFGKGLSMGIFFWLFNAAILLSAALPFITIFLFSKRLLQAKLALASASAEILAVLFGTLSAIALQAKLGSGSVVHTPQLGFVLLLIAPVFSFLARRGILKDEEIATAYKRL